MTRAGAIRTPLATLSWVDSAWQERRWQCAILSLVATKADIRQQAIKGGEAPKNETARAVERYAQNGGWG
jgi:hypothetical protein